MLPAVSGAGEQRFCTGSGADAFNGSSSVEPGSCDVISGCVYCWHYWLHKRLPERSSSPACTAGAYTEAVALCVTDLYAARGCLDNSNCLQRGLRNSSLACQVPHSRSKGCSSYAHTC